MDYKLKIQDFFQVFLQIPGLEQKIPNFEEFQVACEPCINDPVVQEQETYNEKNICRRIKLSVQPVRSKLVKTFKAKKNSALQTQKQMQGTDLIKAS